MKELAYVLINPYTMSKSRTGGVISRLLSRDAHLQLLGARMFAPSKKLVDEYVAALKEKETDDKEKREVDSLIREYVIKNYMPDEIGTRKRVMFLLVEGENVVKRLQEEVVGSIIRSSTGETIRDTYGDYIKDDSGKVIYFEPAVLTPTSSEAAKKHIDLWLKYSVKDSGILYDVIPYEKNENIQNTLVMIKPDTLTGSRTRAGTVIDLFSKTGLYIISIKVIHITVAQAMEFYGPVRDVFVKKFTRKVKEQAAAALAKTFDFPIPKSALEQLAESLKEPNADHEFGKLVQFMTGCNPRNIPQEKWETSTNETCLALVYQGEDAIEKIRNQLGSTDPSQAAPATVRKEFGTDVMINTAHASDSPENAEREIKILNIAENDLIKLVESNRNL